MKQTISSFFSNQKNRNIVGIIIGVIVLSLMIIIPISLASPTPVSKIEIKSEKLDYDRKEPGSFKVTKSAKWISKGKAKITFDVDTVMKNDTKNNDVILVLDTSDSMSGKKLERLKADCVELVDSLLADSNNKVALITFGTSSNIVSNFTNDKGDLTNKINGLQTSGNTNYYQALVNVDNVLKDYNKENDKEVITLFLTDGYPDYDTPNEESQFRYLKNNYSYLTINSIQYEMGSEILDVLKKVSDDQFSSDMESLKNILFEAVTPATYEKFSIIDYINDEHFIIKDESDIKVSQGEFTLTDDNSRIDWTIDTFKSGIKAKMTISVSLKDKFSSQDNLYSTNLKEKVKTTIGTEENITSTLTPILATNYQVIYDGNAPDGCSVKNVPASQRQPVFKTVRITDVEPECAGYKFKGWKIVTDNVKSINDKHFIMPEEDVTLRAEWSKIAVKKSMDGKVYTESNIYKLMSKNAILDTDVNFLNQSVTAGIYKFATTKDDVYPVYYYRGDVTNNNVMFANFCWKIVRTTPTGGIKIIYNGVPTYENIALTEGEYDNLVNDSVYPFSYDSLTNKWSSTNHTNSRTGTIMFSVSEAGEYVLNYTVSSEANYDKAYFYKDGVEIGVYSGTASGSINLGNIDASNVIKVVYTKDSSVSKENDNVSFSIGKKNNETVSCANTGSASTLSSLSYYNVDSSYDPFSGFSMYGSLSDVGYMYSSRYMGNSFTDEQKKGGYTYGNDVVYENGQYTLINTISTTEKWNDRSLKYRHYTCMSTETTCTNVSYVYLANSGAAFYITLNDGKNISEVVDEMLSKSTNKYNSNVKSNVDNWYESNIKNTEYENYVEDTIYCNDRSMPSYNGFNKDGDFAGAPNWATNFSASVRLYRRPRLDCENNDSFTVNLENGNGALTYPVGLISADELRLAGATSSESKNYYLYIGETFWTMTPKNMTSTPSVYMVMSNGGLNVNVSYGGVPRSRIRPVISLKNGTMVNDGNGSADNPYIVK